MRKIIWQLHQKGQGINELAKKFQIDKKTIQKIIDLHGEPSMIVKKSKIKIDETLLRSLHGRCRGMTPRIHEILKKEHQVDVGYSTLTAFLRELGIGSKETERSHQVADKPGEEFQHDTSPYVVLIGDKKVKVQASSLYWRFSKARFLKFYPSFTRFHMMCFFYEAITLWDAVAKTCVVDNTNLVIHHGTGSNATFQQEMNAFASPYGFKWKAHEIRHSDRKAGVEKSLHFVETNFLSGRTFSSLEDMNLQAKEWCQEIAKRPHSKTKLIPIELFEIERPYLVPVHGVPRPYKNHERIIDQYGFISFNGNFFWAPKGHEGKVTVLEYADTLVIYQNRKMLITHPLPPWGTRGKKILPDDVVLGYSPKKKTITPTTEESALKSLGEDYKSHLENAYRLLGKAKYYQLIRGLYSFYRKEDKGLFERAMKKAIRYRVYELQTILNIKYILLADDNCTPMDFRLSEYDGLLNITEGEFCDEADLNRYDYQGAEE